MRGARPGPCLLLALAALCLASCTIYQGGGPTPTREVVKRKVWLSGKNFRVVENHVEGYAWCPNLFLVSIPYIPGYVLPMAFGVPLENPHVKERAMADLMSKVEMEGKPRVLHNVIVEYYAVSYLVYGYIEARISGEVIEFTEDAEPENTGRRRNE